MDSKEIVIDGIKYSVEEMAATHPGGDLFVKAFAGRYATTAFLHLYYISRK